MKKLVLSYKRLREELEGEYPFIGNISVYDEETEVSKRSFIRCLFKDVVRHLHYALTEHPDVERILFHRMERPDILPLELSNELVTLLRIDPLSAFRAMNYSHSKPSDAAARVLSQASTKLAEELGELIYLNMANGYVLDPLTGGWKSLAYGPKCGWKINAGDNRSSGWLKIDLVDDSPTGTPFAFRIAYAKWATIKTQDLLEREVELYFIPRQWNPTNPWLKREDLAYMLLKSTTKKEA